MRNARPIARRLAKEAKLKLKLSADGCDTCEGGNSLKEGTACEPRTACLPRDLPALKHCAGSSGKQTVRITGNGVCAVIPVLAPIRLTLILIVS